MSVVLLSVKYFTILHFERESFFHAIFFVRCRIFALPDVNFVTLFIAIICQTKLEFLYLAGIWAYPR